MKPRLLLVMLVAIFCTAAAAVVASAGTGHHTTDRHHQKGSYEVWLVDQEDRFNAGAGTLYVFDGPQLARDTASALPEKVDLGGAVRTMCQQRTGTVPARPHMIVFNGGDNDGPGGNTHAALAFVASGHVVCQDPTLRPDNAPICPRTTSDGRFTFVTLRGGGMFVVDHNTTPMRIVAEYDRAHVDDNGCGEMEVGGKMYVNSGAGLTVPPVPGDDPWGHDVYSFKLHEFSRKPATSPNMPAARLVYSRDSEGQVDAHAVALTEHGRYLWWGDRTQNDVVVVDPRRDREVNRFELAGPLSSDPAPDLFDLSPRGDFMFSSLRGPNPSSGHEAFGSTPGVGVIDVERGGKSGRLVGVARVGDVRGTPDPHAIRVRTVR